MFENSKIAFQQNKNQSDYRPDIDGLRAIAVLSVVFYHCNVDLFSGGYVGVDVFFVISGYLITKHIWRDLRSGQFSLLHFYERRARRILPVLFLVIGSSVIAGLFLSTPKQLLELADSIKGASLFVSNFVFLFQLRHDGYFGSQGEISPLLHVWSLSVEEQFYLFFPAFSLLAVRWVGLVRARLVLLIVFVVALLSALVFCLSWSKYAFFFSPVRFWELLAGAVIATGVVFPRFSPTASISGVLDAIAIALIFLPVTLYSKSLGYPGIPMIPVVAGTMLLVCNLRNSFIRRILSFSPLLFIGRISYSLYMWHWPVIVYYKIWIGREPSGLELVGLLLPIFFISYFSWKLIEQPIRLSSMSLRSFALGSAVCFLIGLSISFSDGAMFRFSEKGRLAANTQFEANRRPSDCEFTLPIPGTRGKRGACPVGVAGGDAVPNVLILGDSHAEAWRPLYDRVLRTQNLAGWLISLPGCPVGVGIERLGRNYNCVELNDEVLDLVRRFEFTHVIVVQSYGFPTSYRNREHWDSDGRILNIAGSVGEMSGQLREFGVRLAAVLPAASVSGSAPEAILRGELFGQRPDVSVSRQLADQKLTAIRNVLSPHFDTLVDVYTPLCDLERCHGVVNGLPMFYDNSHPSSHLNKYVFNKVNSGLDAFLAGAQSEN